MAARKRTRPAANRKPREYGDPERVQEESSYEIGMDESWKANLKGLFDDFRVHTNTMFSRAQAFHDKSMESIISNQDTAAKNLVAQCQLNMTQAAENHRFGMDRLWANSDTAQGGVDNALLRTMTLDDASLKAIGAVVASAVAQALTKK